MVDKRKAILLRISPELWEQLSAWAATELRSVNAQIEYLLREAVRRRARQRSEDRPGRHDAPPGQGAADNESRMTEQ